MWSYTRDEENKVERCSILLKVTQVIGEVGITSRCSDSPAFTLWKSLQIPIPSIFSKHKIRHSMIQTSIIFLSLFFSVIPDLLEILNPSFCQTSITEIYVQFFMPKHISAFTGKQGSNNYAVFQKNRCPCYLSPGKKVHLDFILHIFL